MFFPANHLDLYWRN